MENSFTYHDPLNPASRPKTDDSIWDKVLEAHKNKEYKKVVTGIIDYVDLELGARTGNADRTLFDIPHGSASIQLKISDDSFEVEAPFLDITDSKKIPLMRKVTELNFSPLNLSTIHLEDNHLAFRYRSPLSLCEPYRTYDALREICIYADSYDDEFINKFDAKWIRDPHVEPYTTNEQQQAWDNLHLYIEEARTGVKFFEIKRSFNLAWDVIVITLMKIELHIHPEGVLRTELEKMISYMTGSQDPMNERVNRGKKYLDKLDAYSREEINKDLYVTSTFVPYKVRSNLQTVKNNCENPYAQSKKEIEQGNHLGAGMTLLYHFFNMFYHHTVPLDIEQSVMKALKESSQKPWHEVSGILYDALQMIMTGSAPTPVTPKKKGGFFSKLFGQSNS